MLTQCIYAANFISMPCMCLCVVPFLPTHLLCVFYSMSVKTSYIQYLLWIAFGKSIRITY